MSANHAERERAAFLACDRFFIANMDSFREAFEKLVPMLSAADYPLSILLDCYTVAILSGHYKEKSILQTMPRVCSVLIWLAYSHLSAGTPLFINDDLIVRWVAGDGAAGWCEECGLRLPLPCQKCSMCGGVVSETGIWMAKRARAAGLN